MPGSPATALDHNRYAEAERTEATEITTSSQPDSDRLHLTPVTAANWRDVAALEVTEAQRAFVSAPPYYLALCSYEREWQPLAVCLANRVIGFVMWVVDPEDGGCWVGGFIIDKNFQRRGYGRRALQALMDLVAAEHGHRRFALSFAPDNPAAPLYRSLGFQETGEMVGGELVARLSRR